MRTPPDRSRRKSSAPTSPAMNTVRRYASRSMVSTPAIACAESEATLAFHSELAAGAEAHHKTAVGHVSVATPAARSQCKRRDPKNVVHRPVELAGAAESRSKHNVRDGKVCVIQHAQREMCAARSSELIGSDARIRLEQAPQLPMRHTESRRKRACIVAIEPAVDDPLDTEVDDVGVGSASCCLARRTHTRRSVGCTTMLPHHAVMRGRSRCVGCGHASPSPRRT